MAPEAPRGWGLLPRWCIQTVSRLLLILTFLHTRIHTQADRLSAHSDHTQKLPRDLYLRVTTILLEPYVMEIETTTGPPEYEGYIVDLMDEISKLLGLKYRLLPVADSQYGYKRSDGSWNGMIGELMRKKADLAAAPLYITNQREQVVDFSIPFLVNHATILLKRPPTGRHLPIESVEDLVGQWEIQYGTLNTGMIVKAFRAANDTLSRTMWKNMRGFRPTTLTDTNDEGIEKTRQGRYAFILPTTIGDYISRRKPCDLLTVGSFLMDRGFGLAVPQDSGLKIQLDRALVTLRRTGFLHQLYEKWWVKRSDCNGIQSSKIYKLEGNGAPNQQTVVCSIWCLFIVFLALQHLY